MKIPRELSGILIAWVILGIIVLSLIPLAFEYFRHRLNKART